VILAGPAEMIAAMPVAGDGAPDRMSAICGSYRRDGAPVAGAVRNLLNKLLHRGPDGNAAWSKIAVGLGHAMLHPN